MSLSFESRPWVMMKSMSYRSLGFESETPISKEGASAQWIAVHISVLQLPLVKRATLLPQAKSKRRSHCQGTNNPIKKSDDWIE